jgi:transposase
VDLARFVVDAVVLEGRTLREVAEAHGVSKSWVGALVTRYRLGGYAALEARSKAPRTIPARTSGELEDRIVAVRKELGDQGLDCGAHTIHYHLSLSLSSPPSVATIWRVLTRRGFITPQPQKRPKSSYKRFEASLPNECWQSDVTFYRLRDKTQVEILNLLDDYSRLCVASKVLKVTRSPDVVATLYEAGAVWGLPASLLTDNGCIYTPPIVTGTRHWNPSSSFSASPLSIPAPTIPRPGARSSASTRPSSATSTCNPERALSHSSRARSSASWPITTTSARIAPGTV